MKLTLAIDFGSTYTKIAAFNLDKEELVGTAQARTTVDSNIVTGLQTALVQMEATVRGRYKEFAIERILSSSSAAGGLRMIAIGLTKALTTKAAGEAVLGAGARLIDTYSHRLGSDDIKAIEEKAPDLILLAGGTDGGDEATIIKNARALAQSRVDSPIIIAGNKMAATNVQTILRKADKYPVRVENILPELDRLNIEPAKNTIREIFLERITHAKGLDKAQNIVGDIIMPTPLAVLKGASLLSKGTNNESESESKSEKGWGDLLVIDVGGATTDIHSIGYGYPSHGDTILKGLPEPFDKRTVEGDLGIRYNASSILEKMEEKETGVNINIKSYVRYVSYVSKHVDHVAQNEEESLMDMALASKAVELAAQRHAGRIENLYFPTGKINVQYGKDLTTFTYIIGTGGILAYGRDPHRVLESACFSPSRPESLCPLSPQFFVDKSYILFAAGLLSEIAPLKALRIMKRYLRAIGVMN
jgi:uncharacterized protein (TIGR01319 family)